MRFKLGLATVTVISVFIMTSCGSSRRVVHSNKKVVVVKEKKVPPKIPQLKQIKKQGKTSTNHTEAYIRKFAPIAIKKMHEYNIPASITLAQGVLESGSGRSPLAIRSNNHFGIKCHRGWKGKSVTHDDDKKGECFRKYKYPESSYEDHSKFLVNRKRYASLFKLKRTNYKGWAYGLKRAGYATDKRYPQKLIGIINKYGLTKYDRMPLPRKSKINTSNSIFYVVKKGDTLYSIAKKFNLDVDVLKKVNKLKGNTISIGQRLVVQ